jgi:hypothetical protein
MFGFFVLKMVLIFKIFCPAYRNAMKAVQPEKLSLASLTAERQSR